MSNQSKSLALPFIIFAGIIFAGAAVWKFMGNGDTPAEKPAVAETSAPEATATETKTTPQITVKKYESAKPKEQPQLMTDEEKKEYLVKSKHYMKFAMRFNTPEKAITGLKAAVDQGNTEIAGFLLEYINDHFPNTEIPSELLDF